jgi:uncharacterized protein YlxP (DUF503 family)
VRVVVGVLTFDLLLGDVHSLKQKRAVVRPIVAVLAKENSVSASETGRHDLHRRAEISVAVVGSAHGFVNDVLDGCEQVVGDRPEVEILAVRRRVLDDDDLE